MKLKRWALICGILATFFSLGMAGTGFFLISYAVQTGETPALLSFFFRFFFGTTPLLMVITCITVSRLKVSDD